MLVVYMFLILQIKLLQVYVTGLRGHFDFIHWALSPAFPIKSDYCILQLNISTPFIRPQKILHFMEKEKKERREVHCYQHIVKWFAICFGIDHHKHQHNLFRRKMATLLRLRWLSILQLVLIVLAVNLWKAINCNKHTTVPLELTESLTRKLVSYAFHFSDFEAILSQITMIFLAQNSISSKETKERP